VVENIPVRPGRRCLRVSGSGINRSGRRRRCASRRLFVIYGRCRGGLVMLFRLFFRNYFGILAGLVARVVMVLSFRPPSCFSFGFFCLPSDAPLSTTMPSNDVGSVGGVPTRGDLLAFGSECQQSVLKHRRCGARLPRRISLNEPAGTQSNGIATPYAMSFRVMRDRAEWQVRPCPLFRRSGRSNLQSISGLRPDIAA
jgi:hypothetical protein